ncbi:hypothetical protein ACKKBG_A11130 [Auxenochlorella protothecoides x Auxenochlorella symbiontica]
MFDDQDLGRFANILGVLVIVALFGYHFVVAEPRPRRD